MKKTMLSLAAALFCTSALAQSGAPMVGDRPLVQVKPKGAKGTKTAAAAPAKPQSAGAKLQACLEIEDGTKERLDCYDAVIPPAAKPKAMKAKAVADCKFTKEQDERLACFNGFVESMPKLPKT
ncbi:conserved hypothetical protein; putative signal peptide [Bradyrhizobium sp. ORS 278]|uniref:hypothetical protein n=1 Tax=Bradyrhizobium sp. (strain ORS 278) TaxID=114615 RepID=UPI00015080F5|nr:hypothetical protein [Bradyrhizobium sp. ORS 278]CAL76781.1 conserved hypothetical protein; putative signal peptide [Bradyrhizobium sp. ORS 278]